MFQGRSCSGRKENGFQQRGEEIVLHYHTQFVSEVPLQSTELLVGYTKALCAHGCQCIKGKKG